MKKSKLRNAEELFFRTVMIISTSVIGFALFLILWSIIKRGSTAMSWEMLTQTPKGGFYFGKEGGIANAIAGSLYLASGATLLALIFGIPVALYMNVNLHKNKKLVNVIRFLLDVMWGIPSIVYGAFGFTLMIFFGMQSSLFAGILTVTLFIIPIMIRSIDEVLVSVPFGLMEASFSLGSTRSETSYKIFLRQCISGVTTAILLSFGRAIGDAAAVLFTTGYTDHMPTSLTQPTATLPLAIFFQMSSPIAEVKERAYASALILTLIILFISIVSRIISNRYQKHKIKI
jgi:phosphate transport system permease protein